MMDFPPFSIPPYSRIVIDGVEMNLIEDGANGKVFEPVDKSRLPEFLSNKDIIALLHHGSMEIVKGRYDPRKLELADRFPYLRDLPEKKQKQIHFRLEWIMRFRGKGAREGNIDDNRMQQILTEIRSEYARDMVLARKNSHAKSKYSYEDGEFNLRLIGASTLRRWYRDYSLSGDDWRSLVDGRGSGEKKSKFTDESRELEGRMLKRYLSSTRPNAAYLFRVMKAMERRINRNRRAKGLTNFIKVCERSTFYNRIEDLPDDMKFIAREGEKLARMRYLIVAGRERGLPLDLVEGDEWKVDLVVLLNKAKVWDCLDKVEQAAFRKASKRVWISVAIDYATNCFLAFRLHERAPSVETALATFIQTNMDKTRFAKAAGCKTPWNMYGGLKDVRVDSAAWYEAEGFAASITDAGARIAYPPAALPPLRGTVERMFGILGSLALQNLSGRTFSNVVKRGDRDPRKEASVDIDALSQIFVRVIVDIHHNTRSTGKLGGLTPREAWNQLSHHKQKIPAPLSGSLIRHVFGVNYTRIIQRAGIKLFGIRYQSLQIQELRRDDTDREVVVRVNIYDLGAITVICGAYAYTVPAVLEGMKGRDYWTWTAVARELDLEDTQNAERTQEQLDDAFLAVDAAGDAARAATNLGSPIPTAKQFAAVDRRITQTLQIVAESKYTQEAREQDFNRSSFLSEVWGLDDEPEPDDLDVPAGDIVKAEAEEAARAARRRSSRNSAKATPESEQGGSTDDDFYNQF
ncbi:hypothetical protein J2045_001938 [Peteryoungia aggregata LMG 23059]|uniref:Integrase catalytic domain-containing protein n=1 Tax=Peteryoungia aggregata LMG 23059 TaxID=1368425 RepID=A0ABU0G6F6_9HYPH|nr:Mu transposase C-terminal domain-containing protein [Peteryoungia aggregata]MDQ0420911.1 hypothetical protein [Peteryoungia aggregata LMG 23059]